MWWLTASLIILAAVLLTFVRLLLPYTYLYKDDIQRWLSQALAQPVQIGELAAEWRGWGPRLILNDIVFLDAASQQPQVRLAQATVALDLVASALSGRPQLGNFTVSGISLSLERLADGRINIAGFSPLREDAPPADNAAVLHWLLSQDRLALENSDLYISDESLSLDQLHFVNANVELRNSGQRHQLDGSASLPDELGRRFSFAVDLQGDIFVAGGWSGWAYLNGSGLQLPSLLNAFPLAGIRLKQGVAELRLWSYWEQARLQHLEGEFSGFGLELQGRVVDNSPPAGEYLDALSGRLSWQHTELGWILDVDRFLLGRRGEFWPRGSFRVAKTHQPQQLVNIDPAQTDDGGSDYLKVLPKFEIWADYGRIDDGLALLRLSDIVTDEQWAMLDGLRPAGVVEDFHLQWFAGQRIALETRFSDISIQPWLNIPGVHGLDGEFKYNGSQGYIGLQSRAVRLEARRLFNNTIELDTLQGEFSWQRQADAVTVVARNVLLDNQDLMLAVDFDLGLPVVIAPQASPPYLDLVAGYTTAPQALTRLAGYLPVGIMPDATVSWLTRSIVSGTVVNGGLLFQGPLAPQVLKNRQARFETRFIVEQGIIDYASDWPRVEEVEAEVLFNGLGMQVRAVGGRLLDADIQHAQIDIANMTHKPVLLTIAGRIEASTAEALRFLAVSPLRKRFGPLVKDIVAQGHSQLDLAIQIPLARDAQVDVAGDVTVQDSRFMLAGGAVTLDQVNGPLHFSNDGLRSSKMTGRIMGMPAEFAIDTQAGKHGPLTSVQGHGKADAESLAKLLKLSLFKQLTGASEWQARLAIPARIEDGMHLSIESDLLGLAANLPEPAAKKSAEAWPLAVSMVLPQRSNRPLSFVIKNHLAGWLAFDETMQLQRGELRFVNDTSTLAAPALPERPGVRITGAAPRFSLTEWWPVIDAASTGPAASVTINQLDVAIDRLELYQRDFDQARIKAQLDGSLWIAEVDSRQLRGALQIPINNALPLVMDLDFLHVKSAVDDNAVDLRDPRELPAARIQSKQFTYDGVDFGSLALTAARSPAGLRLTELQLQSKLMQINAHGDWLQVKQQQYSSFVIHFTSPDIGKSLAQFGYSQMVKRGGGAIDISARWQGSPTAFALARLNGTMHMRIDNGRLLDVEPGVGRVFGLLSLQTLPRRLILDFSDVFSKGFAFDDIKGDFEIKDGKATTSNLIMNGPSARIEAVGLVDMAQRQYNQTISVVPDVSSALPFVTWLVEGPVIGAITLLVQQAFERKIDKASRIRYSVTGSWDNPVIERLDDAK